jgi:uroporphyrin-III C-methyltransferase/precorrin-2 dehydrogenase/sirohydrochlorin ferrochelatase
MRYFPLFVDSQELDCLVVGAGEVAARKIELLLKSDAKITVVAPWMCEFVQSLSVNSQITLCHREFESTDINNKNIVFVATDNSQLNQSISQQAKAQGILVNVVDNTPLCTFITPSIVDRSPVVIAMSSGGVAPVLLRYLRQKLESTIPPQIKVLGEFAERFRDRVKNAINNVTGRRYFWEEVFDGDIAENLLMGNDKLAETMFEKKLESNGSGKASGEVYLVGAGPGDPDLITFRALRLMQKADVVVYDRLVSPEILELVRRDAEKVYVGKAQSNHTLPQQDINQLLVTKAQEGNRVVRLKGGDPFIFGRGGEEIDTLLKHNVGFQVVPGITAASGASSYAGIPLTHRDHAQSVIFATGHLKDDSVDLNWNALSQPNQTAVFYMGLTGLNIICEQLVAHGMRDDTPIALVQSATTHQQKVVTGTLKTIEPLAKEANIKPPALIIVGTVVNMHKQMCWFQPRR